MTIAGLAAPAFAQRATTGEKQEKFGEAAWSAEFYEADKDGDGKLSQKETLVANPNLGGHFKVIDADGDGFITPEEDRAMLHLAHASQTELPVLVRENARRDVVLTARAHGRLVLDENGCLRLGARGPFIIWHRDSRIERAADSRLLVTDGLSGNQAYVGDAVNMAGGTSERVPPDVTPPVPEACAAIGKFQVAGGLDS